MLAHLLSPQICHPTGKMPGAQNKEQKTHLSQKTKQTFDNILEYS